VRACACRRPALTGFLLSLPRSNTTTLEAMSSSRAPPALVLSDADSSQAGPARSRWRPDHLLTQRERREARWEPNINPWDVGWRQNLLALSPPPIPGQRAGKLWDLLRWARPSAVGGSGTAFDADPAKVARLRARTRRVRLGETTVNSLAAEGAEAEEVDRWGVHPPSSDDDEGSRSGEDETGDDERPLVVDERRPTESKAGRGRGWDTRTWRTDGEDGRQ
jgi:hypothetical protein